MKIQLRVIIARRRRRHLTAVNTQKPSVDVDGDGDGDGVGTKVTASVCTHLDSSLITVPVVCARARPDLATCWRLSFISSESTSSESLHCRSQILELEREPHKHCTTLTSKIVRANKVYIVYLHWNLYYDPATTFCSRLHYVDYTALLSLFIQTRRFRIFQRATSKVHRVVRTTDRHSSSS